VHHNPFLSGVGDGLDQSASREGVEVVSAVVVGQTCLQVVVALQSRHVDAGVEGLLAHDELVFFLARGHCVGVQLVWCCGVAGDGVLKWLRRSGSGKKSGEVGIVVLTG
jgi:hypothetical protein